MSKKDKELIRQASTRALEETEEEQGVPKWGNARFHSRMNLILTVRHTQTQFVFDANEIDELLIGRTDPDTGEAPDIDLEAQGAQDKGVSRKHASIVRRDGALQVLDLKAQNGTFLNGQRLVANQPRILRDGDDLRLGHLTLQVKFERVTTGTLP